MVRWLKSKKKKPNNEVPEGMAALIEMTLDEQMIAAENVMISRDFLNLFMRIIYEHRLDGHECVAYCMPQELHDNLEMLEANDMRMILTVALKDMFGVYVQFQQEES